MRRFFPRQSQKSLLVTQFTGMGFEKDEVLDSYEQVARKWDFSRLDPQLAVDYLLTQVTHSKQKYIIQYIDNFFCSSFTFSIYRSPIDSECSYFKWSHFLSRDKSSKL